MNLFTTRKYELKCLCFELWDMAEEKRKQEKILYSKFLAYLYADRMLGFMK